MNDTSEAEKIRQVEEARLKRGFMYRNRVWFVGVTGMVILHLGWYKLVKTCVPEHEKPYNYFPYRIMAKLDPFGSAEPKK